MKECLTVVAVLLLSPVWGQTSYNGFVDKYPVRMATDIYSDGAASAVYAYTQFDTPIILGGRLDKGVLTLIEKDQNGEPSATLTFTDFDSNKKNVTGIWKNLVNNKELRISLKKEFDVNESEKNDRELIQTASLKTLYFTIVVKTGETYPRVTAVRVIDKKTDELEQEFELDAQIRGLNNVSIDDYNFDGFEDFSIFEQSYAGANTSSIYFLYNPRTKHFFKSDFTGTSLSFDQNTKTVTEENVCCGGRTRTTAIYKVVDNKMVLVEQHCFVWDDKANAQTERKWAECK